MRVKAKNVTTGQIVQKNFRATEKVTQAIVEKKQAQFLYEEPGKYVFMDTEDYTHIYVDETIVGDKENFFVEGKELTLIMHESNVLDVELDPQVTLEVTQAAPGVKGNTVSGATKKVQLETGLKVDVPLFIETGERLVIDTRSGEYVSRAD